jgi:hypothetical protein
MTAGATASVTLTARKCDGTVDTSYTGSKALSWASVAASPSGKAAALPATASFSAGTAAVPVTLYAAGTATLAPTTGAVTGSTTVPVAAGSPKNLALTEAATGGVAVGLTCGLLSEPAADRGCVASPVTAPNGKHAWTAKVNLLDTWGNPAAAASALMVTVTTSQGESGSGSFGASATTAPISVDIGNKATGVAMTFTANGISTLTVTNAT